MTDEVEAALGALAKLTNYERTRPDGPRAFDLERPRRLLERLGAPHRRLGGIVVQVAGTKGKGSVARFLDACFRAAGMRTGRFLSPHLGSVLERFAVDGKPIAGPDFARHAARVLEAAVEGLTFFEATVGVACLHFAEARTDAAVLEVGLGGRLDATTVVPTTHNVITVLGLEHTDLLGSTLEAIAWEKACTIRPGVPVWCGVDPESPPGRVIAGVAAERGAPLHPVPPPRDVGVDAGGITWCGLRLPVLGRHQAHNAALAAAAAEAAGVPTDDIAHGLQAAEQPACCELRGRFVVDGAHTVASVEATMRALEDHFPGARPHLVFALGRDKDLDGIAGVLAPRVETVTCVQVDPARGRTPEELAAHPAWVARARACPALARARADARARAGAKGLVLVTGSLYLAGAARPLT